MQPKRRIDLYAECNVEPRAPLELFTAECCSRCVNPDCSRSRFGDSKFEGRISTWYERLFSEVPRMLPDDPRFGKIAGQKFLLIDAATPGASSSWVDPRDLERATRLVVPTPSPTPTREVRPGPQPPAPAPEKAVAEPEPLIPKPPVEVVKRPAANPDLAFANTPGKQGQMLGSRPKPTASEWASPPPGEPPSNAQVVKTGAKVRIGS
jgi:hypothetical protein